MLALLSAPSCDDARQRLAADRDLECRYDGPIPEPILARARLGTARMVLLVRTRAETAFFASMIAGQLKTIRRRRADGSFYPALLRDLALYRRQHRAWRRLARELETAADG